MDGDIGIFDVPTADSSCKGDDSAGDSLIGDSRSGEGFLIAAAKGACFGDSIRGSELCCVIVNLQREVKD